MRLNEIRESFIRFFTNNSHKEVSSSPLIPDHDSTLIFTNSGMVQFKSIFTGLKKTEMKRVVSIQKCLRAGGKDNDLENVGYTNQHHTFFEMLGNFSFGDYFKETAIELAWKFITKELSIDKKRLFVTIHQSDNESYDIWHKVSGFSDDKIIRIATDDNFWNMGSTGPCGPCSEIFYNHPKYNLQDEDRIIEIWNIVFMEFHRDEKGNLFRLPKKCIDTGMGIERIASIMQNVYDNYNIDLFSALINKSQEICNKGENKVAHKIIADHLRAAAFLLSEGVLPGNEGRNYVLRRLIRRAARYVYLIGYNEPLLHRVFPLLIDMSSPAYMGDVYSELIKAKSLIEVTLRSEEENFNDTLIKGIGFLERFVADLKPGDTLSGELAFKLYDTYGFPLDITLDILRERRINFDHNGFNEAMKEQRERARAKWIGFKEKSIEQIWFNLIDKFGKTKFIGYEYSDVKDAKVIVIISSENEVIDSAKEGERVTIILDKTPFYGESGGQVGDTGYFTVLHDQRGITSELSLISVENTNKVNDLYLHRCVVKSGSIYKDDIVTASIEKKRRQDLSRNHSATHLLHFTLRKILGCHVTQKGSMVMPDKLKFDFSYSARVNKSQLFAIEDMVNSLVRENFFTFIKIQDIDQAIKEGAIGLFGKKYSDQVRVVSIGNSKELCGGTHVEYSGEIGFFKIVAECSIASGVRRIEALTGQGAINYVRDNEVNLKKVAEYIKAPVREIISRLDILIKDHKEYEVQIKNLYKKLVNVESVKSTEINGVTFMSHAFIDIPTNIVREFVLQQQKPKTVIAFTTTKKSKTVLIVKVSKDLTNIICAKELLSTITAGGKCCGNSELAQICCNNSGDIITAIYEYLAQDSLRCSSFIF